MQVKTIQIFSKKQRELAAFLSQIFETEIEVFESRLKLSVEMVEIFIHESQDSKNDTVVTFSLGSREALEAFLQKVIFCYYRMGKESLTPKIVDDSFSLYDPDGRKWGFTV